MIVLQDVELRRGNKVLLDGASVTLHPGEKIGVVGRNGAGKSTLFALLNGSLHEDRGSVSQPAHWRRAEVAQHMPETSLTATDFVLQGDEPLRLAQEALQAAEALGDGMAIAHAHTMIADASGHDAKARAQSLILGLGFSTAGLDQPVGSFSGGWQMRLQLARALMCPSDLLLLDEPTNHLDLDALVWLEAWLKRYSGTLLIISHDREFLDAVTRVTLQVDQGKLVRYSGNYSGFEEWQSQQMLLQQAAYSKQQDKIAHLQKFIDRFKAKASKARQAQSRVKALERMERLAPVLTQADFQFEFRDPVEIPNPMLSVRDAEFGYQTEQQVKRIVGPVNFSLLPGQRIGILGANGQGKSTLVKTIAGSIAALAGKITQGKGLRIGYFAQQELDVLSPDDTPLEHLVRLAKEHSPQAREQELRNFLGSFKFADELARQPVRTLSGGERARLVLALLVWQKPNLLLLDEPTNHLDLVTREALAMALNEFEGSVMLVSHDRSLLRSVCDEFWLVGRGRIEPFEGDLEDYQRYLLEESKRLIQQAMSSPAATATETATETEAQIETDINPKLQRQREAQKRAELSRQLQPLRKEIEKVEKQLEQLHQLQQQLEQDMLSPQAAKSMAEMGKQHSQTVAETAELEDRWLHLNEQIEQIRQHGGATTSAS
jgi:ATP-binding cassette subfamily F protein 3